MLGVWGVYLPLCFGFHQVDVFKNTRFSTLSLLLAYPAPLNSSFCAFPGALPPRAVKGIPTYPLKGPSLGTLPLTAPPHPRREPRVQARAHVGLFQIPRHIQRLYIATDSDEAGDHAAEVLTKRMQEDGNCQVLRLRAVRKDFNDDLCQIPRRAALANLADQLAEEDK
jgi:hypothetical protein